MSMSATLPQLRRPPALPRRVPLGTALGELWTLLGHRLGRARIAWRCRRARRRQGRWSRPLRLCLGSGAAPIPGWLNADLDARADLRLDLRGPLPFEAASAALIYSEHVLEHLEFETGQRLLRECRRVLRPDGVLRIAMPDLEHLLAAFAGDWRAQEWLRWPGYAGIDTRVHMLNVAFHGWQHRYLYDFEELEVRLRAAGFAEVTRCELGTSTEAALCGLETRADSMLIAEAQGCR